jgi:Uma2 family endonuclease
MLLSHKLHQGYASMLERTLSKSSLRDIIAHNVTFEDYMERYADQFTEWVEGMVIKLSPAALIHIKISQFFIELFRLYLKRVPVAQLFSAPFVMQLKTGKQGREPDICLVLNERSSIILDTMLAGPGDVVIEIVSPESVDRDLVEKYDEYEAYGVREYWVINPVRKQTDFYVLGDDQHYHRIELANNVFHSTILPQFRLPTTSLWDIAFLDDSDNARALVDAMLT